MTNPPNAEGTALDALTATAAVEVISPVAWPQADPPGYVADRRRPGRMASVNPALVPLLRKKDPGLLAGAAVAADEVLEEWVDRAPARGLINGIAISLVAWAIAIVAFVLL